MEINKINKGDMEVRKARLRQISEARRMIIKTKSSDSLSDNSSGSSMRFILKNNHLKSGENAATGKSANSQTYKVKAAQLEKYNVAYGIKGQSIKKDNFLRGNKQETAELSKNQYKQISKERLERMERKRNKSIPNNNLIDSNNSPAKKENIKINRIDKRIGVTGQANTSLQLQNEKMLAKQKYVTRLSKERLERMEQKRNQFKYIDSPIKVKNPSDINGAVVIDRVDKRIGNFEKEIVSGNKDNDKYNSEKPNIRSNRAVNDFKRKKISEERLKRMERKRKKNETVKLINEIKKKENNTKNHKTEIRNKEHRINKADEIKSSFINKENKEKQNISEENGKSFARLNDRKEKKKNKIKKIGSRASSEAKRNIHKVKDEVLENTEGGHEINKALSVSVEKPMSYTSKAYRLAKDGKESIKIRRQKRRIKKDLKRKERELYAKFYDDRHGFKVARKKLRRQGKVKGLAGKKGRFKPGLISNAKAQINSFVKKSFTGTTGLNTSGDAGQRGANSLVSTLNGIFIGGGIRLLKLLTLKVRILIYLFLAFILVCAILFSTVPISMMSSPFAVFMYFGQSEVDAADGYKSPDGVLKDEFTRFSNDLKNEISNNSAMVTYNRDEGITNTNLIDILAVYAVVYGKNGELADGTITGEKLDWLRDVFNIAVSKEVNISVVEENGNSTEMRQITVTLKNRKSIIEALKERGTVFSEEDLETVEQLYEMLKDSSADEGIAFPVSGSTGDYMWVGDGVATEMQKRIAENAKLNRGWFPATYGFCARWVAGIYANSGATRPFGNAMDYWVKWGKPEQATKSNVPIGAAVITTGDPIYGHIGIYIGNGMVASNLGGVKIEPLATFGNNNPVYIGEHSSMHGKQGYVGWVWPDGIALGPTPTQDIVSQSSTIDPSLLGGEWKTGTASAYGGYQDSSVKPGALTYNESPCTETSMGVAVPMAWGKSVYDSLMGHKVLIEYNGKVVEATINDIGTMGHGSRVLDLQPGVFKSFGFSGARDWGLRTVKYKIL